MNSPLFIDKDLRRHFADAGLPIDAKKMHKAEMEPPATLTLVRAARELLGWNQAMLAERALVGIATVRRYETGGDVRDEKIAAIVAALQNAGITFLGPRSSVAGITEGVALRPLRKSRKARAGADLVADDLGNPRRLPRSGGPRPKPKT